MPGDGNCSFVGPPADRLDVALSHVEYGTADSCGGYLDVTGPHGTVRVKITSQCSECERSPARSYTLLRNPPRADPIAIRVKEGSSRWWLQIQGLDHGNPLARFELQAPVHTDDNFWMAENPGPGDGRLTVRITDIYGQSVTIPNIALAPNQIQRTTARLYGPSAAPPPAPPSSSPPTTTSPPSTTTTAPARPASRTDESETAAPSVDPPNDNSTGAIVIAAATFTLLAAAAFLVRHRSSA